MNPISNVTFECEGAFGRRVRITEKNSSGGTIEEHFYLWDGLEIIEKRDAGTGNALRRYYPLGMKIVSGSDAGDYFYTFDHLGSIREVIDGNAFVVARYDYDPYGRVTQTSGTFKSDFLFTGHFYHEKSGLHLAPYRAYDAELGRWLSRDPLFMAELLPEGPGLYGYGPKNPINGFDPDGGAFFLLPGGLKMLGWGGGFGFLGGVGSEAIRHGSSLECYSIGNILIDTALGSIGFGSGSVRGLWRNLRNVRYARNQLHPHPPRNAPYRQEMRHTRDEFLSGTAKGGLGITAHHLLKNDDCNRSNEGFGGNARNGTGGGSGPVWNAPSIGSPFSPLPMPF